MVTFQNYDIMLLLPAADEHEKNDAARGEKEAASTAWTFSCVKIDQLYSLTSPYASFCR